jgi:Peptidase family M1 domain
MPKSVTLRRIQAHSSNCRKASQVTKVLFGKARVHAITALWFVLCLIGVTPTVAEEPSHKPAETLYLQLAQVGLDPNRVYEVRDASLDRSAIHISLDDGTIAFTKDVMGRITGAFFAGDGEILLEPPTTIERQSMSLFTGMAILEEHFATAYLRFNDDTFSELRPDLRETQNKQEFVDQWQSAAQNLAGGDAMRLLVSFSTMLPVTRDRGPQQKAEFSIKSFSDPYFHARLQGTKLGIFDVSFDSSAGEQVEVGQARSMPDGLTYYDVWTSFSPGPGSQPHTVSEERAVLPRKDWLQIRAYKIDTEVLPPKRIHARAYMQLETRQSGFRVMLFELSRFLEVESVKLQGEPVEFIHNPAVEGTQLARRGNDIVAVILPEPAQAGQKLELEFVYGGEVLAQAASGLLYVGERGTWYPNRGMEMADFDLTFEYPSGWTLVATGKPSLAATENSPASSAGLQSARWISDRPMPVAGFNLGKYKKAITRVGGVAVETYATYDVERTFPSAPIQQVAPAPVPELHQSPRILVPPRPSPARNEASVGESAAQAIRYYSDRFGPYPYSKLALTQMPGDESQGWPSLVFLSSYAFLDAQERQQLHLQPYEISLQESIPAHETAHQWWGDLITWSTYRDQWFSEGLANYCALMILDEKDPAAFRHIMERYRSDLMQKNKDGIAPMDAGPVTLGARLLSSRFPQGYEAITYGRATWLFHMLRTMLDDAEAEQHRGRFPTGADDPFVRALRKFRERYQGQSVTTKQLLDAFAVDLPPALRYENKSSLDWFLDGWVNGTSLPKLQLKNVRFISKGSTTLVTGAILQKDASASLVTSVPLYAVESGRATVFLGRVFADGEESTFHISAPAGARKILLDPQQTILTTPK